MENTFDFGELKNNFQKNKDIQSVPLINNRLNNAPDITICVPTYQRESTLIAALKSIENQIDYFGISYEVLILDNNPNTSVEKATSILRNVHLANCSYYINEKNIGMIGNWNRCIELSNSEWISFLHDDDLLAENYFQLLSLILSKLWEVNNYPIGFIKGRLKQFDSKVPKMIPINDNFHLRIIHKREFRYTTEFIIGAPTCGTLINKRVAMNIGGFNPNLFPVSDVAYEISLAENNYNVCLTDQVFGYYRFSENETLKEETLYSGVLAYDDYLDFVKSKSFVSKIIITLYHKMLFNRFVIGNRNFAVQHGVKLSKPIFLAQLDYKKFALFSFRTLIKVCKGISAFQNLIIRFRSSKRCYNNI